MLEGHVNKYMVHISECINYIGYFKDCEFYTFDTETCCTTNKVYDDYYNKQIKSMESGRHAKVYAWALSNTSNDYVIYGENLNQFIFLLDLIYKVSFPREGRINKKDYKKYSKFKIKIGVHNLKFDAEFLKYILFDNGFKYFNSIIVDNKVKGRNIGNKCFNIVENDGMVYGMNIYLDNYKYYFLNKTGKEDVVLLPHIEFFDTFKIMSQPLDTIGKKVIEIDDMFYKKADTYDYNLVRDDNHKLTQLEKEYLYCDVYILKEFMVQFYIKLGLKGFTASSISYKQFLSKTWGNPNFMFNKVFPNIYNNDKVVNIVKNSYKGGWTFAERHYVGRDMKNINGTSIDINSSYPSQMYYKPLPYGKPHLYNGFHGIVDGKELAIYTIEFNGFYNKHENDYFGFLQAGEVNMTEHGYSSTDYVHTNLIGGAPVGYSLDACERRFRKHIWSFELDAILKNTVLVDLIVIESLVFKAKVGIFKAPIDYFMDMKVKGKKEKNNAMTNFAKLCLNSFYGKMASNIKRAERTLIYKNGLVGFEHTDIEYESTLKYYPPFASAVTAWGRCTLRDALYKLCINEDGSFSPNVLYCDTDSIYSLLPVEDIRKRMGKSLHPTDLGKWDIEKEFIRLKTIGSKKYMLTTKDGETMCKCAGLPKEAREIITYNDFFLGNEFEGKLASKRVSGGILIIPTKFKLREVNYNL